MKAAGAVGRARAAGMLMVQRMLRARREAVGRSRTEASRK